MRGSCERAGAPPSPMDVRTDPCWRGGSGHSLRWLAPRCVPRDFPRSVVQGAYDFWGCPLFHLGWLANDPTAPNWDGVRDAICNRGRGTPRCQITLSFREESTPLMRSLRAKALPYAATSLSLKTSSPGAIVK